MGGRSASGPSTKARARRRGSTRVNRPPSAPACNLWFSRSLVERPAIRLWPGASTSPGRWWLSWVGWWCGGVAVPAAVVDLL